MNNVASLSELIDAAGSPIGFMGASGDEIDALFIDPERQRRGEAGAHP